MSDGAQPPTSIVIRAASAEPTPAAAPTLVPHDRLDPLLASYARHRAKKPSRVLGWMGALVMFVFPFLIFLVSIEDIWYGSEGPFALCCGSFLLGLVMISIDEVQHASWSKELQNHQAAIARETGFQLRPVPAWPAQVGGGLIIVGVLLPILLPVGCLMLIIHFFNKDAAKKHVDKHILALIQQQQG